ncbi:Sulfur carrier protein ThiS [Maioricimonas rarisocia]|uniref:Sulfur carrier protein ThiS n=1 Tax=Maioricimonas rarisocia TaxID=2528026 RepID=A0A517Z6X9_9PLAN|nr:sulfur carrier protein ThiS [Maioricimonas rarisocia]QDU38246.1 Sulfur carrier protein ThiS [Maioricimonas rarisocia]
MNQVPDRQQITVNGEVREIRGGSTVADLIAELKLSPRFLAVERNLELVPRTQHAECVLEDGDRLEIVTLVGGG